MADMPRNSIDSIANATLTTIRNMFSNSTKLDGTLNPFYTVPDSNRDPFTKAEADAYTALFHYWNTTGDESYNKLITERMNTK